MVRNKGTYCVTLMPETADKIDKAGKGKSFSAKLENIVREFTIQRQLLVNYETENEKETGQPRIWLTGAERIWAWSSWLKGAEEHLTHREAEAAMREWAAGKKGSRLKPKEVVSALSKLMQELHYIVQVVDMPEADILEIWIARRESKPVCTECGVIFKIKQLLEDLS